MNTGEDIQGLRKILDLTRMISIAILCLHFYLACYRAFMLWGWTTEIADRIVSNVAKIELFSGYWRPKFVALMFLCISLTGVSGRKDEQIQKSSIIAYMVSGLLTYFSSILLLYLEAPIGLVAMLYMAITGTGYLLLLTGGGQLSRLIKKSMTPDVFNALNETFPQEERLLENEYSINLPAKYRLKDQVKDSWINFINPFRGMLVAGTPGAGKSYFVIRHIIDQHIKKGFSMFLYDFKYDDLSKIAYNKLIRYQGNYEVKPQFYVINFDDLSRSHRCNPLDPESMDDLTDATEASRTNMIKLDISEVQTGGDTFFSSTDLAYFIFMIIGILGYWAVPNVANYVVHAGGGNAILTKVNSMVAGGAAASGLGAAAAAKGALYGAGMLMDGMGDGARKMHGMAEGSGNDYFKDKISGS